MVDSNKEIDQVTVNYDVTLTLDNNQTKDDNLVKWTQSKMRSTQVENTHKFGQEQKWSDIMMHVMI